MNDKLTSIESVRERWEALKSEAPEDPKGIPMSEQLAALRAHKSRVKEFLASLSLVQRAELTKEKKLKRKRTVQKEIGENVSPIASSGSAPTPLTSLSPVECPANPEAEALASRLGTEPIYLTQDSMSWVIHAKKWMPSPDEATFNRHWDMHPSEFHALKLFGKTYFQNRWSQSWGHDYRYSGTVSLAREIREDEEDSQLIRILIGKANDLVSGLLKDSPPKPYNGCLQNWYEADHTIGLHSDDEKDLRDGFPIFSLSWGGTRRFVLKARSDSPSQPVAKATDVMLEDGDLVVMGGTCQRTHKHEVPKRRATKDPVTSGRINWTIRAFDVSGEVGPSMKD